MKYLILMLLVISCADASFYPTEMKRSHEACEKNDGLKMVEIWEGVYRAYCNNKAMFRFERTKL